MERKVDAYIQKYYNNGEIEYNMWMHYNGVDFAFLYRHNEAASFAQYFKRKMFSSSVSREGMAFTDTHGSSMSEDSYDALLGGVRGLSNISDSLTSIIGAATNLDIQSDLTIHLDGQEYPLVRNADNEKYKSFDVCGFSRKGVSFEELSRLDTEIAKLPTTKEKRR